MIENLDEYFFYDESLMSDAPVVMEIGVFTIEKVLKLRGRYPNCRIILIEGDPENFRTLTVRCNAQPACWTNLEKAQLALADKNGSVVFYHYQHEQFHSTFPRHLTEPERIQLCGSTKVEGLTLAAMLDRFKIDRLDLLLLNCEGAEVFALDQLAESATLRSRVSQVCTSAHWRHVPIYPESRWEALAQALSKWYDVSVRETVPEIPYYLFARME